LDDLKIASCSTKVKSPGHFPLERTSAMVREQASSNSLQVSHGTTLFNNQKQP
jgi:hypothetical protein